MSKKTRLRKRLADIDLDENEGEPVEYSSAPSKGFVIKNKYSLNEVHKTFLDLCLYEKTKMVFVDGPAGTAKAQPLDAKILTPHGYTTMGELKINDLVFTQSGNTTKVVGIYPQGIKKIFKVSFSDGTSTECCDDHLWLTQTYYDRTHREKINGIRAKLPRLGTVKTLKEIRNTLHVGNSNNINHSIPVCMPVNFNKKEHVIHPYVLGVLLGDGCITQSAVFTTTDSEILEKINDLLPENHSINKIKHDDISYRIVGDKQKNLVLEELKRLNLLGCNSLTKFIPDEYLYDSTDNRLLLLQGLMDADGWVDKQGGVGFNSVSRELVEGVRFLVESLGGLCGSLRLHNTWFTYAGVKKSGKPCYALTLNCPVAPFLLSRKKNRVHQRRKYFPIRYITNVEEVGEKQAQCIMVEDESHLYLTNNCIVTHNTYLAVLAALNLLQQKKIKKIVYIRSIVESAEKSIGALPGELDEKFKPWSLPMLDKLHELLSDAATDALLNNGTVQCIPVNFVRGLTFHDSVVIVDESQNLSRKELVSILTRFGHNSRFIIAGDLKQNDIVKSGYKEVLERFNDEESANNHIHCVHFGQNEIVRSHILKFIVRKLEC
jgi:hypothetical protein